MNIICPLCQQVLLQTEKRWHCENNHSFDIARQGYTNLLPVHHKKSKSPGDDAIMVTARSQFLNGDYYHPLSTRINQVISEHLQSQTIEKPTLIDAGCGEGYYTCQLKSAIENDYATSDIIGIDISKHAVLGAARRDKSIRWFVANSSALPLSDHGANVLLSLFAPVQAREFYRCLNNNGLLLVASTGSNHLIEIRELLYDDVHDKTFNPAAAIDSYFTQTKVTTVGFTIDLNDTDTIKNLFAMTPHYWRVSPERKKRLNSLDKLSITVDIQLYSFQPT